MSQHLPKVTTYKVKHDGVDANHPDPDVRRLFVGKKNVTNQVTKYKSSAEKTASMLKSKGFKNVRIEEENGLSFKQLRSFLQEKKLTPAEMKKREEVAQAIERENPNMPMGMKMAIATKTAKRVAEDTEQIDELSKEKLGWYLKKAVKNMDRKGDNMIKRDKKFKPGMNPLTRSVGGLTMRQNSIAQASIKYLAKEETEQIDELSKGTLASYAKKGALDSVMRMGQAVEKGDAKGAEKAGRRYGGVVKAVDRLAKEETELEEARGLAGMSMDQLKQEHEKVKSKIESEGKSKMISMNHPLSQRARAIRLHMAIKAGKKTNEEVESEEDQHLCAKHVRSALLGDGVVLEAQHADPDENGQIEWYMVEFRDGIHKVYTEDLEIMIAEYHGNHKKKRMTNGR